MGLQISQVSLGVSSAVFSDITADICNLGGRMDGSNCSSDYSECNYV